MANNNNAVRVGAIWEKTAKSGKPYLSLSINVAELLKSLGFEAPEGLDKVNLSAFKNDKKSSENQPDYSISYFIPTT